MQEWDALDYELGQDVHNMLVSYPIHRSVSHSCKALSLKVIYDSAFNLERPFLCFVVNNSCFCYI